VTPATTTQNLLLWGIALALAILLSFLSGVATHWPENGPIDMRGVLLDVIQTILTTVPLVAAGLGLPRLGREDISSLVSDVGKGQAKAVLEVEAVRQATGVTATRPLSTEDVGTLVAAVKAEMLRDPSGADPLEPPAFLRRPEAR
jgi:hypothetical protein